MRRSAEASLELFRRLGDERRTALALNQLGIALSNLGDLDGGIVCHEEGAAISRRLSDGIRLSAALNNLGYCLLRRGRYDRAMALFEEGLAVCRQIGHRTGESVMLGNLGLAALFESRRAEALRLFRRALLIDRELDYAEGLIYGLVGIAAALSHGAGAPDAAMLLGAAHAAAQATAVELEPLEVEVEAKVWETLTAALGAERLAQAHAAGQALDLDEAVEHALHAAGSHETVTARA
jgi:tetratricopeptide (TPR) repeat protein